jgi:hypothetical protein
VPKLETMKKLFLFFDPSFNLPQALCYRDLFRADLSAPPHGPAAPDTILAVNLCQPAFSGRISFIGYIPEGAQEGRWAKIFLIWSADGTG